MNKTVVITGGTSGIGLATAEHFARNGWNVGVIARNEERLHETHRRLAAFGNKVLTISADVAMSEVIDEAADRFESELGPIAVWINNAMSTVLAPAARISSAEYRRVTETTYLSQVYGTLAALRHMTPRRHGVIVQVSSGLGFRAIPLQAAYCAAKFAVSGFTDSLRSELLADEIPIALPVVYLPSVNTPQPSRACNRTGYQQIIPDPLYDPRLCAEAIFYAAEHPQREFWVGRSTIQLAVAQTFSPEMADRLVSHFLPKQLGEPAPEQSGNLEDPLPGSARIDGDSVDRVVQRPHEFYTSRQREALQFTLIAGIAGLGAIVTWGLLRLLAPRR